MKSRFLKKLAVMGLVLPVAAMGAVVLTGCADGDARDKIDEINETIEGLEETLTKLQEQLASLIGEPGEPGEPAGPTIAELNTRIGELQTLIDGLTSLTAGHTGVTPPQLADKVEASLDAQEAIMALAPQTTLTAATLAPLLNAAALVSAANTDMISAEAMERFDAFSAVYLTAPANMTTTANAGAAFREVRQATQVDNVAFYQTGSAFRAPVANVQGHHGTFNAASVAVSGSTITVTPSAYATRLAVNISQFLPAGELVEQVAGNAVVAAAEGRTLPTVRLHKDGDAAMTTPETFAWDSAWGSGTAYAMIGTRGNAGSWGLTPGSAYNLVIEHGGSVNVVRIVIAADAAVTTLDTAIAALPAIVSAFDRTSATQLAAVLNAHEQWLALTAAQRGRLQDAERLTRLVATLNIQNASTTVAHGAANRAVNFVLSNTVEGPAVGTAGTRVDVAAQILTPGGTLGVAATTDRGAENPAGAVVGTMNVTGARFHAVAGIPAAPLATAGNATEVRYIVSTVTTTVTVGTTAGAPSAVTTITRLVVTAQALPA